MKNPLNYQISEYDCGPTSLYNALSFLLTREEIHPIIIKKIMKHSMTKGKEGTKGTSKEKMRYMCNFLKKAIPLNIKHKKYMTKKTLANCLKKKGCVLYRTKIDQCPHYIIITSYDNKYIYIWDPYYKEKTKDEEIKIDLNHPFSYNRIVLKERIFSKTHLDYACGLSKEFIFIKKITIVKESKKCYTIIRIEVMVNEE